MKQKGLAPILIVLLIALGLGGYLIYQKQTKPATVSQQVTQSTPVTTSNPEPTNSAASPASNGTGETANWKTYTNTKYGFTVNYPSGWKLSTDNYLNNTEDYIIFSTYESTYNGSRLELYKDFIGGFCEGPNEIKNTTIKFNNGIKGKKIECMSTIAINFRKDGNNLWLIAESVNDKNRDFFNQIISTFKFTQ